jgi:AcrR family transcriptional regulator
LCHHPGVASPELQDGRARRGERSRHQIVAALFALVGEGVLQPTAQQLADRAGVGLRTVFRHFEDMDSLFAEMDARLRGEALPLLGTPVSTGAVAARVRALVAARAALFERIAPYKRAGNVQRWRSAFLAATHRALVRELRAGLLRWLPELEDARPELVEALDLALSFEAWDRLRSEQRLGIERARDTLEHLALALLRSRAGGARWA